MMFSKLTAFIQVVQIKEYERYLMNIVKTDHYSERKKITINTTQSIDKYITFSNKSTHVKHTHTKKYLTVITASFILIKLLFSAPTYSIDWHNINAIIADFRDHLETQIEPDINIPQCANDGEVHSFFWIKKNRFHSIIYTEIAGEWNNVSHGHESDHQITSFNGDGVAQKQIHIKSTKNQDKNFTSEFQPKMYIGTYADFNNFLLTASYNIGFYGWENGISVTGLPKKVEAGSLEMTYSEWYGYSLNYTFVSTGVHAEVPDCQDPY